MSFGTELRQDYFNLSINKVIKTRFANSTSFSGIYNNRVFYEDALADPTAFDQRATALGYWVDLSFLMPGLGQHLPTIAQLDFYYAQKDYGDQTGSGDRYGHKLTSMVDDFISIWSPSDASFPLYDFTIPTVPSLQTAWGIVKNSRSMWGWPEERVKLQPDRGLWHEVVTYHYWFDQDLHPSQPLYF